MPKFGKASVQRLATCHADIRKVCEQLIKTYDFSVTCGYRGKQDQNTAYQKGASKLQFPKSPHNQLPSLAVDLVPYPVDWNDIYRFKEMAAAFFAVANLLKERGEITHEFEWGGNWRTLKDYPHFEVQVAPSDSRAKH